MKFPITATLLLLVVNVYTQIGGVRLGDPFPPESGSRFYLQEAHEVIAIKADKKTVAIQKFDLRTHHEATLFRYKDLLPGFGVEALLKVGGKYYLFYSVKDKGAGLVGLLAREIDFETGQFTGETKEVAAVANAGKWLLTEKGYNEGAPRRYFGLEVSENGQHLGLLYQVRKDKKSSKIITYGAQSFDADLNKQWENTLDQSQLKHEDWITDFCVLQDGGILAAVRFKVELENKDYRLENYLWPAKLGGSLDRLQYGDNQCSHSDFYNTKDGKILVSPYLDGKKANTQGLLLTRFKQDGTVKETKAYPFPNDLNIPYGLGKIMGKNLGMVSCHESDDGELFLVAEENYSDFPLGGGLEQHLAASGDASFPTNFSKQILIMKLDADGEMAWARRIRKSQKHAQDALNLSHWSHFHEDKLQILLNDHVENIVLKPEQQAKVYTGGSGGHLLFFDVMSQGTIKGYNVGAVEEMRGIGLKGFDSHAVFFSGDFISVEMEMGKKENALMYFDFDH